MQILHFPSLEFRRGKTTTVFTLPTPGSAAAHPRRHGTRGLGSRGTPAQLPAGLPSPPAGGQLFPVGVPSPGGPETRPPRSLQRQTREALLCGLLTLGPGQDENSLWCFSSFLKTTANQRGGHSLSTLKSI